MSHDKNETKRTTLLQRLAVKAAERDERIFPAHPRLPAEYADLKADWSDFDTFIMGLADRALSGDRLKPEDVEPYRPRYEEVRARLRRMENDFPNLSHTYIQEFQFLEEMLEILRQIAREQ